MEEKLSQQDKKLENLKKVLFKTKTLQKRKGKRLQPNELIQKPTNKLNDVKSVKFDSIPEEVERKSMADQEPREVYNFHKVEKFQKDLECWVRSVTKSDGKNKGKLKRLLRNQLQIGELILILAERLKKKDAPGKLYESIPQNRPF